MNKRINKLINKLYYDIVLKDEIDDRPIFITSYEDEYLVYQEFGNFIQRFVDSKTAEKYINKQFANPPIIKIDLNNKY